VEPRAEPNGRAVQLPQSLASEDKDHNINILDINVNFLASFNVKELYIFLDRFISLCYFTKISCRVTRSRSLSAS
jgi:hypothetical protein